MFISPRIPALVFVAVSALTARAQDAPKMTPLPKGLKPFEYVEAKVPFYPAGKKWGTVEKTTMPMQLPVPADESIKHIVTPVDFEVKLFAAEPDIKRPICMNWDERGRLWIAESVDYPNERKPEGQGRDRIVICEDTDNDGRADKFKVFADKLSVPTSFTFAQGGIVVMQAPHTLFLRDTDGDDVCDERQVLFTGWHTNDTHAGPSNLVYGFDNWIYGICGYAGFDGTVGGERHSFRQGFFRFKVTGAPLPNPSPQGGEGNVAAPERAEGKVAVSKLEFLRSTNNNSWGVGFSEEGLLFGSTANGNPSVYLPIPNRYYEQVRGWSSKVLGGIAGNAPMHPITEKVRQVDHHGHFTSAAGHALYTARTYPKQYWNRTAFVCEPTGHLVATFVIERDGTDFKSRNAWNLFASDDEWTAPIMAEVGPDGNVWVIDWYNYIVQHNPTPAGFKTGKGNAYETDLRDKTHGRIYRLVAKQPVSLPAAAGGKQSLYTLHKATPEQLVAALKHDNLFWRRHAQRLLVERGTVDVKEIAELVADKSVDELGLNPGALHALWTLDGSGALSSAPAKLIAAGALEHPSAAVRRTAALVVPREASLLKALLPLLDDADSHVRLAAFLAVAEMPPTAAAGAAIATRFPKVANAKDPWLRDALTSAAAQHDIYFLQAVLASKQPVSATITGVVEVVAEHYARGTPRASVATLLQEFPEQVKPGTPEERITTAVLAGLAKGWPRNQPAELSPQADETLARLFRDLPATGKGHVIKLANALGSTAFAKQFGAISKTLLAIVADEAKSDAERLAAAKQALELQPDNLEVATKLLGQVSPRLAPTVAIGLMETLGASQAPGLGDLLVKKLPSLSPAARGAALQVMLGRPESTRTLLDAIDKGQVQLAELSLEQKQGLAQHPQKQIAARARKLLERGGGLPSADREKVLAQLAPLTKKSGDVADGKVVFKKHCATCHTHSGEGQKIGPDLTGMAVHPKLELLTQIIDPSRSVEGNYRMYQVLTEDGKVMSGLLASESKTALELYDSQGKKHVLQRDDVAQLIATPKSLMPEGFEKTLTNDELVNLLEFLAQRGKYLAIPLGKAANVVTTRGMFHSEESSLERLVFKDWGAKEFEGVPFQLIDPQGQRAPNAIMLYGPHGKLPPKMPKSVELPCNAPAKAIHLLSGVSGWGFPASQAGTVSMIVRLHYADGKTEDHPLKNGEHFADYIRRVDVPGSKFAFSLGGRQLRYLSIEPRRAEVIERIELVKGSDATAPVVMAVTVETRD